MAPSAPTERVVRHPAKAQGTSTMYVVTYTAHGNDYRFAGFTSLEHANHFALDAMAYKGAENTVVQRVA